MKPLPLTKIYSGDGFTSNPQVLTQVKREGSVAMYQRSQESTPGLITGYEVLLVKVIEAGTPLPGGKTVEESYEQYPGAQAFGRRAWFFGGRGAREQAEEKFRSLVAGLSSNQNGTHSVVEDEVAEPVKCGPNTQLNVWPTSPFTIKQIASNSFWYMSYEDARKLVQAAVQNGELELAGTRKPEGRGKPSQLYAKKD